MKPLACGVIEGFYGLPWTPAQRRRLFLWMHQAGLNTYMYGPKDDPHHRVRWREPYSGPLLQDIVDLVQACQQQGLDFLYALGPGLDLRYADPGEIATLVRRFSQLADLGGRKFALLFDDIPSLMSPADAARFPSFAHAQCHVANTVRSTLAARFPETQFLLCPTEYCGRMAKPSVADSPYLRALGQNLAPDIDVFWTGPEIISESIPLDSIRELTAVLRRPPVIWDNLHANDYDMRRLFLGPYTGRPLELRTAIRGVLTNPNCQFEANFVPLWTLGAWVRTEDTWKPRAAYLEALDAWLPQFQTDTAHPLTRADLERLGDLFYLPLQHGEWGQHFLRDLAFLLRSSPADWGAAAERFELACRAIVTLYDHLTALINRELLHTFYRHLWELKEEVFLLQAFLRWRQEHPHATEPFRAPEFRPGIFRGGFLADLQRSLPMSSTGSFLPAPPNA